MLCEVYEVLGFWCKTGFREDFCPGTAALYRAWVAHKRIFPMHLTFVVRAYTQSSESTWQVNKWLDVNAVSRPQPIELTEG